MPARSVKGRRQSADKHYCGYRRLVNLNAKRRSRSASSLGVMLVCWQLHVAYGVGSLWGLLTAPLKFRRRTERKGDEVPADRRD